MSLSLVLRSSPTRPLQQGSSLRRDLGRRMTPFVRIFNANRQLVKSLLPLTREYGRQCRTCGHRWRRIRRDHRRPPGPDPKAKGIVKVFRRTGEFCSSRRYSTPSTALTLASADSRRRLERRAVVGTGHGPRNPSRTNKNTPLRRNAIRGHRYRRGSLRQARKEEKEDHGEDEEQTYGVNVAAGDVDGDNVPALLLLRDRPKAPRWS